MLCNFFLGGHLKGTVSWKIAWRMFLFTFIAPCASEGAPVVLVKNVPPHLHFKRFLMLSIALVFRYALYGEVSPKLDVFAFGVVLYEIISGRVAISGAIPSSGDSPTSSREGRTLTSLVCNSFLMIPLRFFVSLWFPVSIIFCEPRVRNWKAVTWLLLVGWCSLSQYWTIQMVKHCSRNMLTLPLTMTIQ